MCPEVLNGTTRQKYGFQERCRIGRNFLCISFICKNSALYGVGKVIILVNAGVLKAGDPEKREISGRRKELPGLVSVHPDKMCTICWIILL